MAPATQWLCKCELRCGGANGDGVYLNSYRTYRRHLTKNAGYLAGKLLNESNPSPYSPSPKASSSVAAALPQRSRPASHSHKPRRAAHVPMQTQSTQPLPQSSASTLPFFLDDSSQLIEQDLDGSKDTGSFIPTGGVDMQTDRAGERNGADIENPIPNPADSHEVDEGVVPLPVVSDNLRNCDVPDSQPDNAPEEFTPNFVPRRDDIKITLAFSDAVNNATLDSTVEPLDPAFLSRLRNPPSSKLNLSDRDVRLSIELFLANNRASEEIYTESCEAVSRAFPEVKLLSLHQVKALVEELSGVTPIWRDMCPNSCIAYTGPFHQLESCTWCGESRYRIAGKKKIPRQRYPTIPIAPIIQAYNRTEDGAEAMDYHVRYTEKLLAEITSNGGKRMSPFHDFFDGTEYLQALRRVNGIAENDVCMMLSIDGAQLYRNEASDCWMWIWVVLDLDPSLGCYKVAKVIPGGSIPGPNKPKHLDSFLFPSFHNFVATSREGLKIWKANRDIMVTSRLFLALATADGPGMACLNGRRKDGGSHYYPARLKPREYEVENSSHDDVDLFRLLSTVNSDSAAREYMKRLERVVNSEGKTEYEQNRLETGICKPSILGGFPSEFILGIPHIYAGDIMHLPLLNIPDLLIPLWHGKFDCDKDDSVQNWPWACFKVLSVWKAHGLDVANCTHFIPGSFDRPPRNPAEKISSGYKAWEFLLYFYGLGPCLFYGHLPQAYWENYCKLVRSIQLSQQYEITEEEVNEAFDLCCQFSDEFEELYYDRQPSRIHMVRPAIHAISHIALNIIRIGPGIIYSQWLMERMIGILGGLVMQPSNPYANLASRLIRLAQVNALKAMDPTLQTERKQDALPRGSRDIGHGFTLRRAMDSTTRHVTPREMEAIRLYVRQQGIQVSNEWKLKITRWARVGLPNGQIARSRWKEESKPLDKLRMARNVQLKLDGAIHVAEIHFYFSVVIQEKEHHLAAGSFYGPPHPELYKASNGTYVTMQHARDVDVRVFPIRAIQSVVMMAPDPRYSLFFHDGTQSDRYFMMSKPGIRILEFIEEQEEDVGD